MLIILLEIYEVPTSAWLVPLGTGIITVALLAGSITSDFFESFYYAYITRPYDIGDRVLLSSPGSDPTMASLVVKNVFLVRTEFLNIAGASEWCAFSLPGARAAHQTPTTMRARRPIAPHQSLCAQSHVDLESEQIRPNDDALRPPSPRRDSGGKDHIAMRGHQG